MDASPTSLASKVKHRTQSLARTHCKQGHELTPENTRMVKGLKYCKTCHRNRAREQARKRRQEWLHAITNPHE